MPTQTFRLDDELAGRLDRFAKLTRHSKSTIIGEALEHHLDECEDLEIALSRLRDPDAEWVDHHEVHRELAID